jgi:hypothetical protein
MKVKIYNNNDIYEISIEEPANNIKWLIDIPMLVINDDRIQIDQSIDHMVIKLNLKVNNGDPIMHTYLLSYTEVASYNLKEKYNNIKNKYIYKTLNYKNIKELLIKMVTEEDCNIDSILIEWR